MSAIAFIAQLPGMVPAALLITGLTAGVWLDWLMRRIDDSRAKARVAIGEEFLYLASIVDERQQSASIDNSWPKNVWDLRPRLMSVFINAEKFGIWAPVDQMYDRTDGANIIINYLRIVGTMLADGHFKQARKRALQAKQFVERTTPVG
jgi:hypothetical protein